MLNSNLLFQTGESVVHLIYSIKVRVRVSQHRSKCNLCGALLKPVLPNLHHTVGIRAVAAMEIHIRGQQIGSGDHLQFGLR